MLLKSINWSVDNSTPITFNQFSILKTRLQNDND